MEKRGGKRNLSEEYRERPPYFTNCFFLGFRNQLSTGQK